MEFWFVLFLAREHVLVCLGDCVYITLYWAVSVTCIIIMRAMLKLYSLVGWILTWPHTQALWEGKMHMVPTPTMYIAFAQSRLDTSLILTHPLWCFCLTVPATKLTTYRYNCPVVPKMYCVHIGYLRQYWQSCDSAKVKLSHNNYDLTAPCLTIFILYV